MSSSLPLAESCDAYQCPGEPAPISRAIHLARLAAFYPSCSRCPHCASANLPTPKLINEFSAHIERSGGPRWHVEHLWGVCYNQIDTRLVRRAANVFGSLLPKDSTRRPVLLASDGRAWTAELLAAASDGLRRAGRDVLEIGGATSGAVAWACRHWQASGGVLIGNAPSAPQTVSLKFWGDVAEPWSGQSESSALSAGLCPGDLSMLASAAGAGSPAASMVIDGPAGSIRYGGIARARIEALLLERYQDLFHALRPLKFVLDTSSAALKQLLDRLLIQSQCQVMAPVLSSGAPAQVEELCDVPRLAVRLGLIARQVVAANLDFGIWIDGDGERVRVVDNRGALIAPRRILSAMNAKTKFAAESTANTNMAAATRQECYRRLAKDEAKATGISWFVAAEGRMWRQGPLPACDALEFLSSLLGLLSQNDCALNELAASF